MSASWKPAWLSPNRRRGRHGFGSGGHVITMVGDHGIGHPGDPVGAAEINGEALIEVGGINPAPFKSYRNRVATSSGSTCEVICRILFPVRLVGVELPAALYTFLYAQPIPSEQYEEWMKGSRYLNAGPLREHIKLGKPMLMTARHSTGGAANSMTRYPAPPRFTSCS